MPKKSKDDMSDREKIAATVTKIAYSDRAPKTIGGRYELVRRWDGSGDVLYRDKMTDRYVFGAGGTKNASDVIDDAKMIVTGGVTSTKRNEEVRKEVEEMVRDLERQGVGIHRIDFGSHSLGGRVLEDLAHRYRLDRDQVQIFNPYISRDQTSLYGTVHATDADPVSWRRFKDMLDDDQYNVYGSDTINPIAAHGIDQFVDDSWYDYEY